MIENKNRYDVRNILIKIQNCKFLREHWINWLEFVGTDCIVTNCLNKSKWVNTTLGEYIILCDLHKKVILYALNKIEIVYDEAVKGLCFNE